MTKVLTIACVMLAVSAAAATGASGCAAREGRTAETRDEALKARVESALGGASDVNLGGLTVGVTHGVVMLSGHVASGTEQQSVGEGAHGCDYTGTPSGRRLTSPGERRSARPGCPGDRQVKGGWPEARPV